jgi:predicted nucleotide-binding protein
MTDTIESLTSLLSEGQALLMSLNDQYLRDRSEPRFDVHKFLDPFRRKTTDWVNRVSSVLKNGFPSAVPSVTFENAKASPLLRAGTNVKWNTLYRYLESKVNALAEILKEADPRATVPLISPRALFLVHGRSREWNETVDSFLGDQGWSTIILEDQPNLGATLIEKLETNSEVKTVVVLFTADDVGCLQADLKSRGLQPRARQNVVMELGFFFGKLGRDRVCLLREPEVEIPSDLSGIVYTEIELAEEAGWEDKLRRELLAMGLE